MNRAAITLSFITASALAFISTANFQALHAEPSAAWSQASSQRFVRAAEQGTKLYNIADTKGAQLMTLDAKSLLSVKSENKEAGYLEVEPSEPVRVWVFGRFLETTEESGVLRVRGTGVNMRPKPSTSLDNNYPLSRSLTTGDRLVMISRNNPEKSLAEDWVQVYAPQGTTLWCKSADTRPESSAEAATLFASAMREAQAKLKPASKPDNKPTAEVKAPEKPATSSAAVKGELAEADALYEAARKSPTQDFTAAKAAYNQYLSKNPSGAGAELAKSQLERIALHEEVRRLQSDRSTLEAERKERLARAEAELREASLHSDPLWGRFQTRGWLERSGEGWVIRWAGKSATEVVCSSGRYDLSNFEGCQIGVIGALIKSASEGSPARYEVRRIEVLDGRAGKR